MRLSTRGKYALEALVYLGYSCPKDATMSLHSISEETGISAGYLEQLFRFLKATGIVESKKGKYGGYRLAKPADSITVGDIFFCVEGPLSLVKCLDNDCCERKPECITFELWKSGYDEIKSTINAITLQKLIDDYNSELKKVGVS